MLGTSFLQKKKNARIKKTKNNFNFCCLDYSTIYIKKLPALEFKKRHVALAFYIKLLTIVQQSPDNRCGLHGILFTFLTT